MPYSLDKAKLISNLETKYGVSADKATPWQLHNAIGEQVTELIAPSWNKSTKAHLSSRRAMYLSMEFLMGRAVYNNLLCLGLLGNADTLLKDLGADINSLEEIEDAALGNGGLGRLAACFLDSAATLDLPLDGYGIRYKYGLFRQSFVNGWQCEAADNWSQFGDPWSVRREQESVVVEYGGGVFVRAVPYDMPIIGYGTNHIGTLRLWQAEGTSGFDFAKFDRGDYLGATASDREAENISAVLYPNDNSYEGRLLRLKQEVFFSTASVKDAIRHHLNAGRDLRDFHKYHAIQLNDTHPVLAIPALIDELTRVYNLDFDAAFDIAKRTFNYTNHTIMPEALEKWDSTMLIDVVPRLFKVLVQLNERFISEMYAKDFTKAHIENMKLISNSNTVAHMARTAVYAGGAVNGVAEIHTEILKASVLKDWYSLDPEKFQNKTNGITPRRWLALCNPELSALFTELLGSGDWVRDTDKLKPLAKYADDMSVIDKFVRIKEIRKQKLADYIEKREGVKIAPSFIFDVQVKRLHEYKRQLLNAFSILYIAYGIKSGEIKDFQPTAFIFGAKAAPAYTRAKTIIKYINEIAKFIKSDPQLRDLIKVLFVQNYNVSYAEYLVSGADVSEQISTAGTEASGTGNMKFMQNGTVTLGTYDGANIEIVREAGEENNYIFGAKVEDIEKFGPNYDPRKIILDDSKIEKVLLSLIDGTLSDDGSGNFRELYYSLLEGASWHKADNYYLLYDLRSYVDAKLQLNRDFVGDKRGFYKKCWLNAVNAGFFSSDRTIKDYAENIWRIKAEASRFTKF
ncbi:MAG: glycogen/starch/alpha-glucan family phosphorylase [Oscillospiraceae bacterium]|jgi:starch phosphorylase|nr:glycogen/starch/alpha-glucan family phosphorylase [Oscillospiraceae bacterium]